MGSPSRVLVTGISGFTGVHLADRLTAAGCEVFGLTNSDNLGPVPSLCADLSETDRALEDLDSGLVTGDAVVRVC